MKVQSNNFVSLADIAIHNDSLQQAVSSGTMTGYTKRLSAMYGQGEVHGQALRQQATRAKRRALMKLPDLLEQAEANLQANGIEVRWAVDADEANQHVMELIRQHGVKTVAKSKSMATEEIGLNHVLEAEDIEVVETDLGEYIIQLNGETPSHIITPVIHKTKAEIRDIFVDKLDMQPTDNAEDIVAYARQKLREVFLNADMGITGGNFIIAETGSLALVMNEGNGRMVTSLPKVHVAIVGIEKIVETVEDYVTLTQVLPRSGTGQNLTVYSNILNGPRRTEDEDGPEHIVVIFLDNGRSNIYTNPRYVEALACIRCGACLNACPVYRVTGGHAYGWVYGGPIGAVISPLLVGIDNATPLPNASSLCGACKQACPVDIDLPRMLLDLRDDIVQQKESDKRWDWSMKGWEIVSRSPRMFSIGGKLARVGLKTGIDRVIPNPLGDWKQYRDFPDFAPKPFRELWKERQKAKSNE